jgi:hypothetical protein
VNNPIRQASTSPELLAAKRGNNIVIRFHIRNLYCEINIPGQPLRRFAGLKQVDIPRIGTDNIILNAKVTECLIYYLKNILMPCEEKFVRLTF